MLRFGREEIMFFNAKYGIFKTWTFKPRQKEIFLISKDRNIQSCHMSLKLSDFNRLNYQKKTCGIKKY